MKRISAFICLNLWIILLCLSSNAQDFQTVHDGIEQAKVVRQMKAADGKDENVVFNLLRLDLSKVRLDVVHAMDSAIGLEKTSSIAARHGAIAAINAGFFRIDKSIFEGDNVSLLMIDGKLLSENPNNRTALFIENQKNITRVNIEKGIPGIRLTGQKFNEIASGINRERKADELILYTPEFHRTTLTGSDGIEIEIRNGKVKQIFNGRGSSNIPDNGFVLSATGKSREKLKSLKIGSKISVEFSFGSPVNDQKNFRIPVLEDAVSGSPQLIKNGVIDITWQEERSSKEFVETHHPRTAVAKLKDGKFLMVVVDGRSEESGGISLPDLAAFLLEMGATDAMNLDGGGSSTMVLDGKVVSKPSDKEGERKIGDAILVFPRAN